ncbi:tyrosine-type recombinase/integrase [Streptomyces sp. NRRL S-350]|uniref:tyrosine-type recombinase/integrase n=1 Tax=Streptomyces sp. NRRL S-350 TaxID=1463902 RepID=UPI0004BF77C4|nr:site-specific integrase [Streptomyces sp. NRRL S-350]
MDYFFTSTDVVRRFYEPVPGVDLDAVAYVTRPGALPEGTPFFVDEGMRPAEPLSSFFRSEAKTLAASSLRDYTYDLLDVADFLGGLDPAVDLLSACEDDLVAYRDDRTRHQEAPLSPASWRRRRTAIGNLYSWAVEEGLLERRPYHRRRGGRDVLAWGAVSQLDVRHLTFEQWRFLKDVGLRGLLPDGGLDPSFRGRNPLRDSCAAELAISTGMRLREFSSLLDIEVGRPRRDAGARLVDLEAAAKYGLPRTVEIQDATLREIDLYRRTERAQAVRRAAPALARHRAELFVVDDIDLRHMRLSGVLHGRRRSFAVRLMSAPLRRITVMEGTRGLEPMALFVGRHGRMIGRQRWDQVFDTAQDRCEAVIAEWGLELEMPSNIRIHDLRHTFAVFMLELLTQLVLEQAAEQLRSGGRAPVLLGEHMNRNAFLRVQLLLGHRRPESTMRYLRYIRRASELVARALREWNDQDTTFADYAAREASRAVA